MPKLRTYHVAVYTPHGRTSYITPARDGGHAFDAAFGMFPDAKSIKVKPVTQHRA